MGRGALARLGEVGLAVILCGVAGLLASPASWLHHFVWVAPLAVSLVLDSSGRPRRLPRSLVILGWGFVGWVAAARRGLTEESRRLPNGADSELAWSASEHLVASVTALVGVAFLITAVIWASQRLIAARSVTVSELDVTSAPVLVSHGRAG